MNMRKRGEKPFRFSWRDLGVTIAILAAVSGIALLLWNFDGSDVFAPMLFVTAVFLIARYTDGYLYGVIGAAVSVVAVNFIFTYPYFAFNFTLSGYPITFISLFVTSVMTSTMTTRIKNQEKLRLEAEKEKTRANLLRAVSHDLRTPLTSIMGTATALIENGDKFTREQETRLLTESRDDAEWLLRMVENLLSVTRINGEGASLREEEEAAEEIVGEAVMKFHKRFPASEVAVSVPEELLMIPMDAILIEQVIINLLENAVIHGGREDGISLSLTRSGERALFTVEDHGKGIPENRLPRLFEGTLPGEDSGGSDSSRNMGIGLAVCHTIVKAHGGEMTAENKKEGGARVAFALPLEKRSI